MESSTGRASEREKVKTACAKQERRGTREGAEKGGPDDGRRTTGVGNSAKGDGMQEANADARRPRAWAMGIL